VAADSTSAAFFAAHRFFSAADSLLRPAGVIPHLRAAGAKFAGAGAGAEIPSIPRNGQNYSSLQRDCLTLYAGL
jgi:hypothetical protein